MAKSMEQIGNEVLDRFSLDFSNLVLQRSTMKSLIAMVNKVTDSRVRNYQNTEKAILDSDNPELRKQIIKIHRAG